MRYEYRVIFMDDPHTEMLTEEQRRQCLRGWNEALDRSMCQIFEGKTHGW